ncbi:PAAR domain-containing protein [Chromohalobacter israelensis]|uniref:Zn-binding protein involved in type VI secretion n=1 Tax=Chromohalobacter israelensis (strain ATCC BAA-138 / DSM 3043 / CIP 106854 / NCIMB 13768 / 1H11) TaxID=290398 RepID=Q1R0S9_CHRI1|nr:PAAR domain-containing protein [Chromohalobacter salexigens]ABE57679.1 conserved hypothetical protein [Chromohalobacter salexigens DSM 3043]
MIRLGDATSHGGKVITGQSTYIVHGKPVAVVGDKVTCPVDGHGGVCTIVEGNPTLRINGKQAAFHGCHTSCGATLVSSMNGRHMIGTEEAKSPPVPKPIFSLTAAAAGKVMSDETTEKESQATIAPGFHVVREAGYRDQIKRDLLPTLSSDVDAMFERPNTHLPDYVLPGSLIVLSDPENKMCTAEEQTLQDQARLAQQTVQQLKPEQADVMMVNWGAVMDLSDAMGSASTAAGTSAGTLQALKSTMDETWHDLAQAWESGSRRGEQILERATAPIVGWMDRKFGLEDKHRTLKAKLGVLQDKAVHTVEQAMAGFAEFHVPTVAEGIQKAGKFARTLDVTNYVAIGLDIMSTRLAVERACNDINATKSCRQVELEEYIGLGTGIVGGSAGASAAVSNVGRVCLAIGYHPMGRLACTVVLVSGGAYGGSTAGKEVGRRAGSAIYEYFHEEGGTK